MIPCQGVVREVNLLSGSRNTRQVGRGPFERQATRSASPPLRDTQTWDDRHWGDEQGYLPLDVLGLSLRRTGSRLGWASLGRTLRQFSAIRRIDKALVWASRII